MVLGIAACQSALDLGSYSFIPGTGPDGGTGGFSHGGAGGEGGSVSSGNGGGDQGGNNSGGPGGSSGVSGGAGTSAGSAGSTAGSSTGGTSDAGSVSSDGGTSDAATPDLCGTNERCVPPVPLGWTGPIIVRGTCNADYPTLKDTLNQGLQPSSLDCSCSCTVDSVACHLFSQKQNVEFDPVGTCSPPPGTDDCISVVADATCSIGPQAIAASEPVDNWNSTKQACGGALPNGVCGGGTCYPATSLETPCIYSSGDIPTCPAAFPQRSLHYESYSDNRACGPCPSCSPNGDAVCQYELDICDVGGTSGVLLSTGDSCRQLQSSDGEGLTLTTPSSLPTNPDASDPGTCDATPGPVNGTPTPTNPVTVCCLN